MDWQYFLCSLWCSAGVEVLSRGTCQGHEPFFHLFLVGRRDLLRDHNSAQVRVGRLDDVQLRDESCIYYGDYFLFGLSQKICYNGGKEIVGGRYGVCGICVGSNTWD